MRTLTIPARFIDQPDAVLTLTPAPHRGDMRDYVDMTLSVDGETVATGRGFGCGGFGVWDDRSDEEIADTFGAFLGHAVESSEDDARDGWDVPDWDVAAEWVDACVLADMPEEG